MKLPSKKSKAAVQTSPLEGDGDLTLPKVRSATAPEPQAPAIPTPEPQAPEIPEPTPEPQQETRSTPTFAPPPAASRSSYDFPAYLADLTLAAQKARNEGSPASAEQLDEVLKFAIHDGVRAGAADPKTLQRDILERAIDRAGPGLYDMLVPGHAPTK